MANNIEIIVTSDQGAVSRKTRDLTQEEFDLFLDMIWRQHEGLFYEEEDPPVERTNARTAQVVREWIRSVFTQTGTAIRDYKKSIEDVQDIDIT